MAPEHFFSIWPPGRKGYFSSLAHDLFGIWMGHFSSMAHDLLGTWPPDRMCHYSSIILYDPFGNLPTMAVCILATRSACSTSLVHHIIICFNSRAALIVPYISLSEPPHTGEIEKTWRRIQVKMRKNPFLSLTLWTFCLYSVKFFVKSHIYSKLFCIHFHYFKVVNALFPFYISFFCA